MSDDDESGQVPERRADNQGPPTMVMQAYREMDADDKNKMEKIGYALVLGPAVVVLLGGVFYDLAVTYLAFATVVFCVGVCFIFPALGVWLGDKLLKAAEKIIPALGSRIRPDKRGD